MGWTARIWKGEGVDQGFMDKAVDALDYTLDHQVSHWVDARDMGDAPSWVIDCGDDVGTIDSFEWWLESNGHVTEGDHHMLVVDCANNDFYSRGRGDVKHDPNDYDDNKKKYARSIANAATWVLGHNRYKCTVIHEFGHTSLDESYCPYDSGGTPSQEHSCGGIIGDLRDAQYITPMLVANVNKLPEQCDDSDGNDGYTTEITPCTTDGMEAYHNKN